MNTDDRDLPLIKGLVGGPLGPSTADVDRLRARLAERADAEGLLDVAYRIVDSPFGALLVATTTDGLVRVAFEREVHDTVLANLASKISPRILPSDRRTDDIASQLDEYFAGNRRSFDVPLDLRLVVGFRRTVLCHLREIAYGTTESYVTVATAAGNPKAMRAVGSACSHNPIPFVIPCHRVVRSDGSIGQYLGGPEVKAALLALEAAT